MMNPVLVIMVLIVISIYLSAGPEAAAGVFTVIISYFAWSDRKKLGKTLTAEVSKTLDTPNGKIPSGTPLVCIASGSGDRVTKFGDCMLSLLKEQHTEVPQVRVKAGPEGVLLSPTSSGDSAGVLLPMGSFWTPSYTKTLVGLSSWQVKFRQSLFSMNTALQCAKIGVQSLSGSKAPKAKLASVVLGTLPSGEALVTQRCSRGGSYNGMWVFPGGKVDIGESPEEGAMREFEEETGLRLIPGSIRAVALWQPQDLGSGKTYLMICYTGTIAEHDTAAGALKALKLQPEEVATATFLPPAVWPSLLPTRVRNLIQDNIEAAQEKPPTKLPAIKCNPERDSKDRVVHVKAEVLVRDIARGIGGGHQFALLQLGMSNLSQFEYDFLRNSGEMTPKHSPKAR